MTADTESDEQFVERIKRLYGETRIVFRQDVDRLFALARRGAAASDEIDRLRAALRDMAQEDATNARRMRTAIVLARKKLDISRPMWTGPILQADGILAQALTVNNDSAALEERT